ncbi:hypothetical protein HNO89_003429 [Sporosarcina luteola]|nr:hypothetical protein [Sporosarcina luteola]
MGRDNHNNKTGKNSRSLPQTPKNQKISSNDMKEEIASEMAELHQAKKQKKFR